MEVSKLFSTPFTLALMNSFRVGKWKWDWSPRVVGAVAGGVTVVFAYLLATVFLILTTNQPLGTSPPFTTLTGKDGVFAPIAVIWTLLDAHWIHPSVVIHGTGVIRVRRDILGILGNRGKSFGVLLRTGPPFLLIVAGAFTATLLRWKTSKEYGLYAGAVIAVGYAPLVVIPGLLARVPVAPNATGDVQLGNTIFAASKLTGVTAHPDIFAILVVAIFYPTVFGAVGAWISTVPGRLCAQ